MNIVKSYAKLMDVPTREIGIKLLQKIEWCGRISHRSEDAQTPESWDRFIRAVVLGHGDWSIVEHVSATVDFLVDRGITHELVRHRLFSFTQESTRFVNYEKKMPPSFIEPTALGPGEFEVWHRSIETAETAYQDLLKLGNAPQIARSVFPNALASRIIITGNLRNWRHIFLLRSTKEAHPQMKEVIIPLLHQFKERIPILFEDIEPEARQIDNMRKPR
jgi:thymidylate synthase (FAD)